MSFKPSASKSLSAGKITWKVSKNSVLKGHFRLFGFQMNGKSFSGSPANLYVYDALVGRDGRFMSLDRFHVGHFSHGFQDASNKYTAASKYFEVMPYRLDVKTGLIDYENLEKNAKLFRTR